MCAAVGLALLATACGEAAEPRTAAARGRELFTSLACTSCHGVDAQGGLGPRLRGLAGSRVQLADGTEVVADAAYLRESVVDPEAQIVAGYPTTRMPDFRLAAASVGDLVAYLESIGKRPTR